ncbi:MAG: ABC transporter permease [Thermoleophilia bacterium]
MTTTAAEQAAEGQRPEGVAGAVHAYVDKLRGGDLGSLPAVLGLTALVILFGALKGDRFLSSFNFANLVGQAAMIVVIAMGLIFVLLLGEIDLAAGVTAGMCAAVLGVTMTEHGWPMPAALAACLLTGVVVGLGQGILVANFGIPSFVVTLATFLAFQGVLLLIIGDGGTIGIRDETILAIQNDNLPVWAGWALAAVVAGGYALLTFIRRRGRAAAGLATEALTVWLAKTGFLVAVIALVTFFLTEERSRRPEITSIKGIPYVLPLILILFVGLTFLLTRTSFGRHVYAVGGNMEAARRAGINVARIRIICFVACSTLAAVAGILFASRDNSISPSTGGSTTLLLAVGAAVIGGTSLFGGKGRIIDAIIGGLVVGVIQNGLPLVTEEAGIQYAVTGGVLLIAASVDALSRKRSVAR